jgi:microcystin-dependent protein
MKMQKSLVLILLGLVTLLAVPAAAQSSPFVGEIELVGFNFAPQGWAFCDGSILPISQNQALFSLLGTTYGGDGQTTFALPDLRGRRIIGYGSGPGLSPYNIGDKGGVETVTLTVSQIPAHTHAPNANTSPGTALTPSGNFWGSQNATALYSNSPSPVNMAAGLIGNAGGGQPHDNMQPYLVMNYIISLFGIFPSQN